MKARARYDIFDIYILARKRNEFVRHLRKVRRNNRHGMI